MRKPVPLLEKVTMRLSNPLSHFTQITYLYSYPSNLSSNFHMLINFFVMVRYTHQETKCNLYSARE